ncbi:hypothetical protein [Streptomyces sp. NPDC086023]|uniref:hypothetical protein n=1 Tax=Streptomyces sp. NPDC086023 TaxID=3365746 RepID=UPI0037D22A78
MLNRAAATQVETEKRGDIWHTADNWAEGSFLSSMKRMSQALEVRRLLDQILKGGPDARAIVACDFNAEPGAVPVLAICGNVEDTNNRDLATSVPVPIEHTIPADSRHTLCYHGRGQRPHGGLPRRDRPAHRRHHEFNLGNTKWGSPCVRPSGGGGCAP